MERAEHTQIPLQVERLVMRRLVRFGKAKDSVIPSMASFDESSCSYQSSCLKDLVSKLEKK
jgi:hypothetical protein